MRVLRADSWVDAERLTKKIRTVAVAGAAMDVEVVTTAKAETYIILTASVSSSHAVPVRQEALDRVASAIAEQPGRFGLNWASVLAPMR
jgi:hypothetical protein